MGLAGRWQEVLEPELGAGGGACNGAVGNANTDARGRGVAVVDGGALAEVDAGGFSVSYFGVVDRKIGWVRDGWAAGQGDCKSKFVERLYEIRSLRRLRFCCYVQPRASGGPVGHPVLVGNGVAHDVFACGSGLVAFLGVGACMAGVAMSNAVAVRPAVAQWVRSPLLVGVIAAAPLPLPPLDLATSRSWRVLTWLVRVELEVAREELDKISCSRIAFLLVAALARLLRALSMESRRPGLRVVAWAELARPR
jgi:hypothetical protein